MSDSGEEAVGHLLLITAVAIGALSAAQIADVAVRGISALIAALG